MDSSNQSSTISMEKTILPDNNNQQPKLKIRNKIRRKAIYLTLSVLLILALVSTILHSISKNREPKLLHQYLSSGQAQRHCRLTTYPRLCYSSMSSILNTNTQILESNPGPIFSTSLQTAVDELNKVNGSLVGPGLSECGKWVHDSLSQLNKSLHKLGNDSSVESLTFEEVEGVKARIYTAVNGRLECWDEIDDSSGLEEVKAGVEKARKHMVNSVDLLEIRNTILYDFYNPFVEEDEYYYYYRYSYHQFDYRFVIFLYSMLYLFLVLLYFLFWRLA